MTARSANHAKGSAGTTIPDNAAGERARAGPRDHAITTASGVHRLDAATARQRLPVRIEGVVTHYNKRIGHGFFVQDETDGVYVAVLNHKPRLAPGDRVLIDGESGAGDFAPVVRLVRWKKLGKVALPPAEPVTAHALASGRFDSRRVEVRGIVRGAIPSDEADAPHLVLQLRSDDRDLIVRVNEYSPASRAIVDAEVLARGVAAGMFNWQRQLLAPVVLLESDAELEITAPPGSPRTVPLLPIEALFRYDPDGFPDHRVRIRGQMLGGQAGRWLAVRDRTAGLFVEASDVIPAEAGDRIEVLGFPETREHALWLMNTVLRRVRRGTLPPAVESTVDDALHRPCELRCIEGTLAADPRMGEGNWVLNLRAHSAEFEAWVPALGARYPIEWREGARLAVTGITEPALSPGQRLGMYPFPRRLRLHVRAQDDVRLVALSPWGATTESVKVRRGEGRAEAWHNEVAARHAAGPSFALLAAERARFARELHDTLEQCLASVALQLDAARGFLAHAPAEADRLLESAVAQIRESRSEVRRAVWNLRSVALENATLPDALRQFGEALSDIHGSMVEVRCEGRPVHVAPEAASHLFRIAQEGVTNALKHARARRIEIVLAFAARNVRLDIVDDGAGFDAASVADGKRFGLRGMRERAAALGAALSVASRPGRGTRLSITVPLARART